MALHKEVKTILKAAERAGGRIAKSGSGHWKVYDGPRLVTVISSSPSHTARGRILADLRRGGLAVSI